MPDRRISQLTGISGGTLADGDMFPVADASDLTLTYSCTALNLKTFVNTAPSWAAGSATAGSWPTLGSGTLLTTAEAGALERDANCFYGTSDAGNRGNIPLVHFIRADAARTLPNDTNENAIFNSPTNGRITLETGCYLFESLLRVTAMSATSGNALLDWLGAGTATVGSWLWFYTGVDNSTPETAIAFQSGVRTAQDSAASIVTATTGTALGLYVRGSFEVTAAGTMIPSIDLVTAASASVAVGSYFLCHRIGSTTVASLGQWD